MNVVERVEQNPRPCEQIQIPWAIVDQVIRAYVAVTSAKNIIPIAEKGQKFLEPQLPAIQPRFKSLV